MALHNEILSARFNKLLTRLFSMKGQAPAPQLASEITPQISLFSGVENRYLETWNRYVGSFISGQQAAINSAVRFRNPKGSNVIAVLEKLYFITLVSSGVQASWTHSGITGDFTNLSAGVTMDFRNASNSNLIVSTSVGATADLSITVFRWVTDATFQRDAILSDADQWTLLPGDTFQVRDLTVNDQLLVGAIWRERPLEESELI